MNKFSHVAVATLLSFSLIACGGGSSSSSSPEQPSPSDPANNAPTVSLDDVLANENEVVTLVAKGTDDDGDSLTYSWQQTSGNSVTFSNNGSSIDFVAPDVSVETRLTFEVTVSDGVDTANATNTVTVINVNNPPTVSLGNDFSVDEQTQVTLTASAFDADNDDLTYSWSQIAGTTVQLTQVGNQVTFESPEVDSTTLLGFRVVIDDGQDNATDEINVSVNTILTAEESVMALFHEMNTLQWEVFLPQQEEIWGSAQFQECETQACLDEFLANDPDGTLETYGEIYIEPHDFNIGNKDAVMFRVHTYMDHINMVDGHGNNYLAIFESDNTYTLQEMDISGASESSSYIDVNGDGLMDIYYSTHGYDLPPFPGGQDKLFFQQPDGSFVRGELEESLEFSHGTCNADFDANGYPDIVVAAGHRTEFKLNNEGILIEDDHRLPQKLLSIEYLESLGIVDYAYWEPTEEFGETWDDQLWVSRLSTTYWWCTTPDVNNDGYPDIVLGGDAIRDDKPEYYNYKREEINGRYLVLINNGFGYFPEENAYYVNDAFEVDEGATQYGTVRLGHVDFNQDGHPDLFSIITEKYETFAVNIHLNDESGTGNYTLVDTRVFDSYPEYYQVVGNTLIIEDVETKHPVTIEYVDGAIVYRSNGDEVSQLSLKNLYTFSKRTAWEE